MKYLNRQLLWLLVVVWLLACYTSAPISPTPIIPSPSATHRAQELKITPTPPCALVTALQALNLRSEPSETSEADPQGLRRGDVLEILDRESSGWFHVKIKDGRVGYVRAVYVVECGS